MSNLQLILPMLTLGKKLEKARKVMNKILRITIEFMDSKYHGRSSETSPEWPPSPFRLFQAMIAGTKPEVPPEALLWLETLGAPKIIAPSVIDNSHALLPGILNNSNNGHDHTSSTCLNGADFYRQHIANKCLAIRISQNLSSTFVHFIWNINIEPDCFDELKSIVGNITSFGLGRDKVIGSCSIQDDELSFNQDMNIWTVSKHGSKLRVPDIGSTNSLIDNYCNGCYSLPCFRECYYDTNINRSNFVAFELHDFDGSKKPFDARFCCNIASWVRHVSCNVSRSVNYDWPGGSEQFIAGHVKSNSTVPRLAYIPLPSIGHRYADGLVRRVMVAGFDLDYSSDCIKNIGGLLFGKRLTDINGSFRAILARHDDSVVQHYVGSCDSWHSVTPMVLPGHYRSDVQAVKLVKKSLDRAGLGSFVSECEVYKCSFYESLSFKLNIPIRFRKYPLVFARIKFDRPVCGPISLGSARYAGLGVFARG